MMTGNSCFPGLRRGDLGKTPVGGHGVLAAAEHHCAQPRSSGIDLRSQLQADGVIGWIEIEKQSW